MNIFEKNCAVIEQKDSILVDRLRAYDGDTASVQMCGNKNKEFVLRYEGHLFNSRYGPWEEAALQADEIIEKKPDCVALFGLGCGYLFRTLLKMGIKKIFIFEPSMEILTAVLREIDLSRELSERNVFLANYIGPFISWIQRFSEGFDNIIGYHTMPYRLAFPGELRDFVVKIENSHTSQKVGIRTEIDSRLDWLKNYFLNLDFFSTYPSVDVLTDKLKGLPMVIVGAGPSLAKNAALLADIKDKAFIVSAITAYKSLLRYGVTPHAVISGEKVDLGEYFEGGEMDKRVRLILSEVSHPAMFRREARGKFIFYSPYISLSLEQASLWGSSSFVSIGGSVTTAMFDMGVKFGCDPIVFIGQDLAFEKGKSHAEGGVYDKQRVIIDKKNTIVKIKEHYISGHQRTITHKLQWLKGINGEPVASKYDWVTFHQWFERYMVLLKEEYPALRVFNATEGGAFIKGMEHTSLEKVINKYIKKPVPIEEILLRGEALSPDVDTEGLVEAFKSLEKNVTLVSKLSQEIMSEAGRMKASFNIRGLHTDLVSNLDKIKKKEKKLFNLARKVSFLWEALVEYTYDLKNYLKEEADKSTEDQFSKDIDRTIRTYGEVRKKCLLFLPMIREGLTVVQRLNERAHEAGPPAVNHKR